MRADVAQAAVDAGAVMVNDVSGGKADSNMLNYISTLPVPYVLMHWRGHSNQMDNLTDYMDLPVDVSRELADQVNEAVNCGIDSERIVLDPGVGFAKTAEQNWNLLSHLDTLQKLGKPLLVGASRKKFLGALLAHEGNARPVDQREAATTAVTTLCASKNVWAVRVHDVRASRDAIEVVQKLRESR